MVREEDTRGSILLALGHEACRAHQDKGKLGDQDHEPGVDACVARDDRRSRWIVGARGSSRDTSYVDDALVGEDLGASTAHA